MPTSRDTHLELFELFSYTRVKFVAFCMQNLQMALSLSWRVTSLIPRAFACRTTILIARPTTTSSFRTYFHFTKHAVFAPHETRSFRYFTSSSQPSKDLSYEELKKALISRSSVVIDVREPWELREYGSIPGSINVPLGQVNEALQLDPGEFKKKYGGDMPSQSQNIVFTCLAGVRSKTALHTAESLAYTKVQHYPGGWQDWAEHELKNTKIH